jgi:2-dehydro-3-deoxygluconokinase
MSAPQATYDVVTLGETMLRLTPPGLRLLEQAARLELEVGGSESNVAIGLARLGLRPLWLSRLTDNPLGRLVAGAVGRHGVDVSRVVWTAEDRVGLYFLEEGRAPRGSRVTYDRAHSAASRMRPEELPEAVFTPGGARLLHLTGITPALGAAAAATARRALELARAAGWATSFDLNYRAKLWTPEQARAGCEPFAAAADLLFIPQGDARTVYGFAGEPPEAIVAALAARYPRATLVITLGKEGALGQLPGGGSLHQPAFPAEEVGRLGGGDAFVAGFLYAYLTSADAGAERLAQALRWGAATAALKYSLPGDAPLVSRADVEAVLARGGQASLKR